MGKEHARKETTQKGEYMERKDPEKCALMERGDKAVQRAWVEESE